MFAAIPSPCLIMTLNLTIVAVNQAYADACGLQTEELLGRYLLDPFPRNPADPMRSGRCATSKPRSARSGPPDSPTSWLRTRPPCRCPAARTCSRNGTGARSTLPPSARTER
ncbi:PAS domain-containing protein [Nonomuraea sp. CA-141351]|uniref:PAS domain-containing protein n=1 Tax=Nonomuraea sp. CA-141351 TaxID=3239996 RepID=UPI003D94053B